MRKDTMPLTRNFNDTLRERAARDPAFRAALFTEAVQALLAGDPDTTTAGLCAYVKATIGFEALARATGTPPKSLMRTLGPSGNPTAANLCSVIAALQKKTGLHLEVRVIASKA